MLTRFIKDTRGNFALITALIGTAVIGVGGFGIETGLWYYLQNRSQSAADISAHAGAVVLRNGGTADEAEAIARARLESLGYSATNGHTITISSPPTSGTFSGDAGALEVTLNYEIDRIVSELFSSGTVEQNIRSVAAAQPTGTSPCILALNTTVGEAIDLQSGSRATLNGCTIASNSVADNAVDLDTGSGFEGACIAAVGGIEVAGSSQTTLDCSTPLTNQTPVEDIYSDLMPPELPSSCDNISPPGGGGGNASVTVSTGPSGIRRVCDTSGNWSSIDINFEPGIYIFDAADFSFRNATITGTDVTFIFRDRAELDIDSGSRVSLAAPTSGDYSGILFYNDPASSAGSNHTFSGGSRTSISGAFYFPEASLTFDSGSRTEDDEACVQLIADTVQLQGGSRITADCEGSGLGTFDPPKQVRLVE